MGITLADFQVKGKYPNLRIREESGEVDDCIAGEIL
jgi:hypothetical protein